MKKIVSIVIPVFNEEKYITNTLLAVAQSNTLQYKKEIIVVDDGSTDTTAKKAHAFFTGKSIFLKKNNCTFYLFSKKKNTGKGSALKFGLGKTTGEIVIIQDADLEYDPSDYPLLLEPFIRYSADVVYGSRFQSSRPRRILYFWHYYFNKFLTTISNFLTGLNLTDMETGYKVFRGDIIRSIAKKLQSKRFGFEPEVTARIAKIPDLKLYEVGIAYRGRTYKDGKKIHWKDGILAIVELFYFNLIAD